MTKRGQVTCVEEQAGALGVVAQRVQAPAGALPIHRVDLEAAFGERDRRRQAAL
jgi:hypothetical protein